MAEISGNNGLGWQTREISRIESQGLFDRVANLGTGDRSQNKTAAPTGIGSGGDEMGKLTSVSGAGRYRNLRILATHFGLDLEAGLQRADR